jgi:8-oxo-dGTP diphosphatase
VHLVRALVGALASYLKIGWWGLVSPRFGESEPLVVLQAVILDEQGILLAVRSDLWGWELPGGGQECGESPEEGLRREVREETGLDVAVESHVGDYVRTGFRPHTARVYRCRVLGGELRTNWETLAQGFFEPDHPPDTLFPWYREPIRDALADRPEVVHRRERQGLDVICAAIRIDLRMRLSGDYLADGSMR